MRELSLSTLAGAVLGDASGITAFLLQAGQTLTTLRYSREAEDEADQEGMRMMQAAKIDPAHMIRFFETLKKRQDLHLPGYLSIHPKTTERSARLNALATIVSVRPTPLLQASPWSTIAHLCR